MSSRHLRASRRFLSPLSLCAALALSVCASLLPADAAQAAEPIWRHGLALVGSPTYPEGFDHFAYVNLAAPKGGDLKLSEVGTFDTLNPVLAKGDTPGGLGFVFDTLMKASLDEISAEYGLIAEAVQYPDDIAWAKFRLRKEAKFSDGSPVTAADVVFSFDKVKELNPQYSLYYAHVSKAEAEGDDVVKFTFDQTGNRELPFIVGQLTVLPKGWWEGKASDGTTRDIGKTTLEPVIGSGPYAIDSMTPGQTIRLRLRSDYWGKDLPVNKGQNNFGSLSYTFYGDRDVEFESFRSGLADYWEENEAKRWATAYDFPAVKSGEVKRETPDNASRRQGVMVGFIPNTRRPVFAEPKLRAALNYAFNFEELNRTVFFGQYERIDSYYFGSEFAAHAAPDAKEQALIDSLKDRLPKDFDSKPFANPVGGTPEAERANLRQAIALLKEAGYDLKGGKMVETKTGKPLAFEILLNGPTLERVALPFKQSLAKIGIEVSVRTVDAAQYLNRIRAFDYDMIYSGWGESSNPGNEQQEYWGSKAADRQGSKNYAGIRDPLIDDVVAKVIFAPDREAQVAAVRLLDRLLIAGHYIVPGYTLRKQRIAYWDRLDHPADYPTYGIGFPDIWWSKAAK